MSLEALPLEMIVFVITAAVAAVAALLVVLHRNPVVNAVALIVNLACLAVFFLLLRAPFLAAVQVIVEEAGGTFTDAAGASRIDSGTAVTSNGLLHDELLAALAAS